MPGRTIFETLSAIFIFYATAKKKYLPTLYFKVKCMNEQLTRVFKQCYPRVAEYILANSGTPDEAKEAYAEAWQRVLMRLREGHEIQDYAGYLFTIARNVYIRERRHKGIMLPLDSFHTGDDDDTDTPDRSASGEPASEPAESPTEPVEGSSQPFNSYDDHTDPLQNPDNWGIVGECLAEMPLQRQRILRMALIEGLSDDDIATQLDLTTGTVANAKTRCMNDIRSRAAQLLHSRGDSYFLKILSRKKAEKDSRKLKKSVEENPTASDIHPPTADHRL